MKQIQNSKTLMLATLAFYVAIAYIMVTLWSVNAIAQTTGTIDGKVTDQDTHQEIIGAKVEVVGTTQGAISDVKGYYRITGISVGTYRLRVTAQTYRQIVKTDIIVEAGKIKTYNFELKVDIRQGSEVVVRAESFFPKAEDAKVSVNTLSQEEIRRAPGASEDVTRMMLAFPSVSTSSDSRSDLIVRGGNPSENYITIDGIEIPNINHFGSQGSAGGGIGMINVDFLNDVTFSAGGFSAKYGDYLSSAMDIKFRDGNKTEYQSKAIASTIGIGALSEGPLQNGTSSYMVTFRKSYYDVVLKLFNDGTPTNLPVYTNANMKVIYDFGSHKLELLGVAGEDDIVQQSQSTSQLDYTEQKQWQYMIGLSDKWLISKQSYLQTSISTTANRFSNVIVNPAGGLDYQNVSREGEYVLKSDFLYRFSPQDLLEIGISGRAILDNENVYVRSYVDDFGYFRSGTTYNRAVNTTKANAYLQYTKMFFGRVSITGGVRYSYFAYLNNPSVAAPRVGISYDVQSNLKFNVAAGIYYQAPPMVWLESDLRNRDMKYLQAQHLVLGTEYYPKPDIKVTIEGFYKAYKDYAASNTDPEVSLANFAIDYGTFGLDEWLVSKSIGYARGIDVSVQKKLFSDFYGIFSYSYSNIQFAGLDGVLRPGSFDSRNLMTVIFGYKIDTEWELGVRWRFAGGVPYTPYDTSSSVIANKGVLNLNQVNGSRYINYERLDIRLDYRTHFYNYNVVAFVDFQNVFGRQNVSTQTWDQITNTPTLVYQSAFVPVIGVRAEF
jgi:hypothetical protein